MVNNSKTILITGASGFVGTELIQSLLQNEKNSKIIGTFRSKEPIFNNKRLNLIKMDLLNSIEFNDLINKYKPNEIYHLAAESSVSFSWLNPQISTRNNLEIYLNLLEAVRMYSPLSKILCVGSSETYGLTANIKASLKESDKLIPVHPYGVFRVAQEHLSDVYTQAYSLQIIKTRSFNHFGENQDPRFLIPKIIKSFKEKATRIKLGNTSISRDFLHVEDVVDAYQALMENGEIGEVYNVCSSESYSIQQIIEFLSESFNHEIEIISDKTLIRPNDIMTIKGDNSKLVKTCNWEPKLNFLNKLKSII